MDIELTSYEMMSAALVGVMRQVKSLNEKRVPRYGVPLNNGWQINIEGAMGECAVAKALGIYWDGSVNNFNGPDVGLLEVRTTDKASNRLILHDRDSDDANFILVIGLNGRYTIQGYIPGKHGKHPNYWSDPAGGRPAYFVPQEDLWPISDLVNLKDGLINLREGTI